MLSAQEAQLTPAQRCEFYEALMHYAFDQEIPHFDSLIMRCLFNAFKINVDNNIRKLARHHAAVENGKKGGGQPGNINACKSEEKRAKKRANDENKTTISLSSSSSSSLSSSLSSTSSLSLCVCKGEDTHTQTNAQTQDQKKSSNETSLMHLPQKSLQERNIAFYNSLLPYIKKYGTDRIRKFYDYWVELSADKSRMRFEQEQNWILESRLARWKD